MDFAISPNNTFKPNTQGFILAMMSEGRKKLGLGRRDFLRFTSSLLAAPKSFLSGLLQKQSPLSADEATRILGEFTGFLTHELYLQGIQKAFYYREADADISDINIKSLYQFTYDSFNQILGRNDIRDLVEKGKLDQFFDKFSIENNRNFYQFELMLAKNKDIPISERKAAQARLQCVRFIANLKDSILRRKALPNPKDFIETFRRNLDEVRTQQLVEDNNETPKTNKKESDDTPKTNKTFFEDKYVEMLFAMKHNRPMYSSSFEPEKI